MPAEVAGSEEKLHRQALLAALFLWHWVSDVVRRADVRGVRMLLQNHYEPPLSSAAKSSVYVAMNPLDIITDIPFDIFFLPGTEPSILAFVQLMIALTLAPIIPVINWLVRGCMRPLFFASVLQNLPPAAAAHFPHVCRRRCARGAVRERAREARACSFCFQRSSWSAFTTTRC